MGKYRKKPVVIEARQWADDADAERIRAWLAENHVRACLSVDGPRKELFIPTLEGEMMALQGDWIIRGIKGEFYPCKPDIFEATYEPADV